MSTDYLRIVEEERDRYPKDKPLGDENAWRICNAVALRLREIEGDKAWGLHMKGGHNYNGFAIDIVGHLPNTLYDILFDGEGEGKPKFEMTPGSLAWAPPIPVDEPGPTDPGDPGPVPGDPPDDPTDAAIVDALVRIATADERTANASEVSRDILQRAAQKFGI